MAVTVPVTPAGPAGPPAGGKAWPWHRPGRPGTVTVARLWRRSSDRDARPAVTVTVRAAPSGPATVTLGPPGRVQVTELLQHHMMMALRAMASPFLSSKCLLT